jgi:hypothetical protein
MHDPEGAQPVNVTWRSGDVPVKGLVGAAPGPRGSRLVDSAQLEVIPLFASAEAPSTGPAARRPRRRSWLYSPPGVTSTVSFFQSLPLTSTSSSLSSFTAASARSVR